jgi:hypothetical protein
MGFTSLEFHNFTCCIPNLELEMPASGPHPLDTKKIQQLLAIA